LQLKMPQPQNMLKRYITDPNEDLEKLTTYNVALVSPFILYISQGAHWHCFHKREMLMFAISTELTNF